MAPADDRAAIERVARDYFESWFDGDEERMAKALHCDLVKRRVGDRLGVTTKDRMIELTRLGEGAADAADRRLEIVVHDVHDAIASATVRSAVYYEYLHLVRTSDGWRIANTVWESA